MTLLFVHGWGFDAGFWQKLRDQLAEWPSCCVDLGYFGGESLTLPSGPVIAIGHSFGLLWLLKQRPLAWQALVAINGFTRFAGGADFPEAVPPRQIARLQKELGEAPAKTVADFRARWGDQSAQPAQPDVARLQQGLVDLRDWDLRSEAVDLALCGQADGLITPAHSLACFGAQRILWHPGGHLLPLEDPLWCAAQLRNHVLEPQ